MTQALELLVPKASSPAFTLEVEIPGKRRLDLEGASLAVYCKRFAWQTKEEAFHTIGLGKVTLTDPEGNTLTDPEGNTLITTNGLPILKNPESDRGAIVQIAFSAADTAAFPAGTNAIEIWISKGAYTMPFLAGTLEVPVSLPGSALPLDAISLTVEDDLSLIEYQPGGNVLTDPEGNYLTDPEGNLLTD